jgi:oligoribonuclease
MEMSGLNPRTDRILEYAAILTDGHMQIVDRLGPIVIHQPASVLEAMDEWCTTHHMASGLTPRVQQSTIDEKTGEQLLYDFVAKHCGPRQAVLAGNSVHCDKRFLAEYFPRVDNYLHYRILDVSTIKEIAARRYPTLAPYQKKEVHRALEDIEESLAELRYYYDSVFLPVDAPSSNQP